MNFINSDVLLSFMISFELKLTLVFIAIISIAAWVVGAYRWRLATKEMNKFLLHPPFSMWFGNIPAFAAIMSESPIDGHPASVSTMLWRKSKLGGLYVLDNYPAVGYRQMVCTHPAVANQVTVAYNSQRHQSVKSFVGHIVGTKSMFLQDDKEWKRSRQMYNPGFAPAHLLTLVAGIVENTMTFRNLLKRKAESREILLMEDAVAKLTFDIIGRVVIDHDFKCQSTDNEFVRAFRSTVSWSPGVSDINPFAGLNPVRPIMQRWNTRVMDGYIGKVVDERFALRVCEDKQPKRCGGKPIIDIALDQFIIEQKQQGNAESRASRQGFKQEIIDNMKTFLFAGYDTSSSTIAYIYHMLAKHPQHLANLRAEYDEVFGLDVSKTAELLENNTHCIGRLIYTTAVIKEVLRLFPPATAARQCDTVISYEGVSYPTKGHMVWINAHTIHRNEILWPSPDDFIPERFLPAPNNYQDIVKDAWRPFEKGPRSCIGQEFAMIEMKIIMAMTLRDFDFKDAYEEWDVRLGRKIGERRSMFGERAYQVLKASAKPVDSMPMRVAVKGFP